MSVSITSETEQLLREQVKSGRYSSTEEALSEAVRLLVERERRKSELRAQVQSGIDEIERGEFTEYAEGEVDRLFDEIRTQATEKLRSEQ